MKKLVLLLCVLLTVALTACGADNGLESITIEGAKNKTVNVGDVFNPVEGVTAIGSDGVDYSEFIKLNSFSCGFDDEGNLYTTSTKKCDLTYTVVVDGKIARENVTITIN